MAVMLLMYFLFINQKFLTINPDNLYDLALIVAESQSPIDTYLPA